MSCDDFSEEEDDDDEYFWSTKNKQKSEQTSVDFEL